MISPRGTKHGGKKRLHKTNKKRVPTPVEGMSYLERKQRDAERSLKKIK